MRPRGRFRAGAFALATILAASPLVLAQSKDIPDARSLYEEGARLYNLGQYDRAVQSFEQAYAISGAKPLLFNIAQAHRLAGPAHCEAALRAYETYLREDSQTSNRTEVEQRIVEMHACNEKERARAAALQAARPPEKDQTAKPDAHLQAEPSPPQRPNAVPFIVVGIGAAVTVAGGIVYWRARVKYDDVKSTCPCPEGSFSNWQTATNVSYGLLAFGGATMIAGLSWWVFTPKAPGAASSAVAIDPRGIYWAGEF
jgi:tetratricopeptide (TPR) repeat protein